MSLSAKRKAELKAKSTASLKRRMKKSESRNVRCLAYGELKRRGRLA